MIANVMTAAKKRRKRGRETNDICIPDLFLGCSCKKHAKTKTKIQYCKKKKLLHKHKYFTQ